MTGLNPRFWIEKNTLNDIKVEVPGPISEEEEKKEVEDPWDYWVFGLSVSGYFNGQETSDYSSLNSNVSVKRVTEKNKFSLRVGLGETKQTFTYEDEDIVSINSNKYLNIYETPEGSKSDPFSYILFRPEQFKSDRAVAFDPDDTRFNYSEGSLVERAFKSIITKGAELFVYNENKKHVIGKFNSTTNSINSFKLGINISIYLLITNK